MKFLLLPIFTLLLSTIFAQENASPLDFNTIQCLDNANKLVVNLKAKSPEEVVILEKDYIVSSPRVKGINERFTPEDFSSGRIIKVAHEGMADFSEDWLELIKVLINTDGVLKLKEHEENQFLMLVNPEFSTKELEKIANKAKWSIQLSEGV